VDQFGLGDREGHPDVAPFAAMVDNKLWRRRILHLCTGEVTVIEKSSTYETMRPLGIAM